MIKHPIVVKVTDNIKNSIKIDRGSRWGNPFVMGEDGDRDDVCDLYEKYAEWRLKLQPDWLNDLKGTVPQNDVTVTHY